MTTQHTPGPWAAGRPGLHGFLVWQDIPGKPEIARTEANACVLGASPDMLVALEAVLYWDRTGCIETEWPKLMDQVLAACAKARNIV